eukprot:9936983-Ditylum_brightwellii.AAC.1
MLKSTKVNYIKSIKIDHKSLKFANRNQGNKPLPILFYVPNNEKKSSPSDYQTYKLWTNPKDEKSVVYNLVVKYYKVGTPEERLQFMDAIAQSLLKGDALQVFKSQEIKDGPAFTKCLAAVTEHVFPKKAYNAQKKCIQNICKPLVLGSREWILRLIKLNDYLEFSPVPDGVTATKIAREEFVDVLEDR